MSEPAPLSTAHSWYEAMNARDAERLVALAHDDVEVEGPRGVGRGAELLRAWVDRLEKQWNAAVALTSEGRARVWRLYMAASALSFEAGKLGVDQVLVQRRGGAPPPLRLREWI